MRRSTRVTALAEKVEKEKLEKIEAGEDEGIKVIDEGKRMWSCGRERFSERGVRLHVSGRSGPSKGRPRKVNPVSWG